MSFNSRLRIILYEMLCNSPALYMAINERVLLIQWREIPFDSPSTRTYHIIWLTPFNNKLQAPLFDKELLIRFMRSVHHDMYSFLK